MQRGTRQDVVGLVFLLVALGCGSSQARDVTQPSASANAITPGRDVQPAPPNCAPCAERAAARDAGSESAQLKLPLTIATGQLITDPTAREHRPNMPDHLRKPGTRLWGMFRICVTREGTVSNVRIVKSLHPEGDPEIVQKIRGWRYRPYMINSLPQPFCYMLHYKWTTS